MPLRLHSIAIIFPLAAACGAGLAFAAPTPAAPTGQPMGALYGCAEVKDPAQRLACFDKEVASLRSAESAGTFRAVDSQTVKQLQKESFGFQLPSLPRLGLLRGGVETAAPAKQTYTVQDVRRGERAAFVMADGTVWRQTEIERSTHIRPGMEVVVEKAALGSFMLSAVKGGGAGLRVRREE